MVADIRSSVLGFTRELEALRVTYEAVVPDLESQAARSKTALSSFIADDSNVSKEEVDGRKRYSLNLGKLDNYKSLISNNEIHAASVVQTQRALFVALISCYDNYLGLLLRGVFYLRPELLNASERELTFKDLVQFSTIEAAREYVVSKEIEGVIRESHHKQFKWMESRLSIKLLEGLSEYPAFIELTQRRNLAVHAGGLITEQYIDECKKFKYPIGGVNIGDRLEITEEYFNSAYETLFEIGFKLGAVLWRKFDPSEIAASDGVLISVPFDLIREERYGLAIRLLEFATETLKKHEKASNHRVMIINLAQAHRWSGDSAACARILNKLDWSDCAPMYEMAKDVLCNDYKRAAELMLSIGDTSKYLNQEAYHSWPLFKEFRVSNEFKETYKKIYGDDYTFDPSAPTKMEESEGGSE